MRLYATLRDFFFKPTSSVTIYMHVYNYFGVNVGTVLKTVYAHQNFLSIGNYARDSKVTTCIPERLKNSVRANEA